MEENIQPAQAVQKPEGSVAWHVITVLVTNYIIGGSVNVILTLLSIVTFSYNLSVLAGQVLGIVFDVISVAIASSLAVAYLLTKYTITPEMAKKIVLWSTGILLLLNTFSFLGGGNIYEIISPLIYVATLFVVLSYSFDQNRNYLQSFTNQRVRLIEGLIFIVGILSVVITMFWVTTDDNFSNFINRSALIEEKDKQEFNKILQQGAEKDTEIASVHGDSLKSELDMYYALYGKKYPESLDDADFQEKRISNFFGGNDFLFEPDMNDYTYTVTDDFQQFELCLKSDSTMCWQGTPSVVE